MNDPEREQGAAPEGVAHHGRALARHSVLNLLGQGIPVLAAIVTVPMLLRGLGTERFGILTLAWVVLGYFSLFDLGLGRALTQGVAERRNGGRAAEIPALVRRSTLVLLLLGAVGGAVALAFARPLALRWLAVTPALEGEALRAFALLALAIPLVTVTSGVRGALEGYQRFDLVNAIRIPMGISNYVAPALLLPWHPSLPEVVIVLMVARALSLAAHLVAWRRVAPRAAGHEAKAPALGTLLATGGWMTVSNVVSPLMASLDRFLVGTLASTAVVAYYATPSEMVTKLWIVPAAVAGALFPVLAGGATAERSAEILVRGIEGIALMVFPAAVIALLFADEGLRWWLGAEFASHAAPALRILTVGVFVNCLAQLLFVAVQGAGRARWTALLHLAELPLYLVLAWFLIRWRAVEGAALAWTARVLVDAIALLLLMHRRNPAIAAERNRGRWLVIAGSVAVVVSLPLAVTLPVALKLVIAATAVGAAAVVILRTGAVRAWLPSR